MTTEFTQFGLHSHLEQVVAELGYTTPTPIQTKTIPVMLTGQDVIGQAQTGTGKTAAFALPMLHNLVQNQRHVQGLILTPTRELALQVADALDSYGRNSGVRVMAVFGGQSYDRQIRGLKKGIDLVVGTPGRLLDLIGRKKLDLSRITTVVLDEADEMLSMGFIEDIEAILNETPDTRQMALFSATLPAGVRRLANRYMHDPQSCTVQTNQLTVAAVDQRYYLVNEGDKLSALTRLFEIEDVSSALIFARTRLGTGALASQLTVRGFPAEALNGDMSQDARLQVLNRFRRGQLKVLVATDVAARGLDIDDISHVFNFDLPLDPEVYVHRIGRTGRAGKTGVAISLVTPREQWRLRKIETLSRQSVGQGTLPSIKDIKQHREAQLVEQLMVWLRRGRCRREKEILTDLVEAGYDPLELAAVALKLARGEEKQRPIDPIGEVEQYRPTRSGRSERRRKGKNGANRGGNRATEAGMVRLSLSTGKANGVRVNHIVSALAHYAGIPGQSLGKIRIQDRHTLVDVPEQFVGKVLAKTGSYRISRRPVTIERA